MFSNRAGFSPEYKERWEISDSDAMQKLSNKLEEKFAQLRLIHAMIYNEKIEVDHAIVFGATAKRMHIRLERTLEKYDQGNLKFNTIYLLGSSRELQEKEKAYLEEISVNLPTEIKSQKYQTEADAFERIWHVSVDQNKSRNCLKGRVKLIDAKKFGPQYQNTKGQRPTTPTTLSLYLCEAEEPLSVFSSIEMPYTRVSAQLRWQVWTNDQTASLDTMKNRMSRIKIATDYPEKGSENNTIVIQEIARQIYFLVENLEYLANRIK